MSVEIERARRGSGSAGLRGAARGLEIEFPRLSKYLKNYVSRGHVIGLKLIGQCSSLIL